jgi:chromosome segregation ATPase
VVSVDEEVILLEEQLLAAQADIERLQGRLADAEARAAGHEGELSEARRQLTVATATLAEREEALRAQTAAAEDLRAVVEAAAARARDDAACYRALVLAHEPDLPADLVTGDSIASLEQSLHQARQTVAQVRQHIEKQAHARRVPAGAPVRSSPDLSGLTPAEKIRLGMSGK